MPSSTSKARPSSTAAPNPAPKPEPNLPNNMLVIWNVPPKTGQPTYDFYNARADFAESLDGGCGNSVDLPLNPIWTVDDPTMGRIDNIRADKPLRQAPGKLGTIGRTTGNCVYTENTPGNGEIACDGNVKFMCRPPSPELADKISPNNGACPGIENIENVRSLVMVCLLQFNHHKLCSQIC